MKLSSIFDYTNSVVEIHASYRKLGYPVDYFDWILAQNENVY